MAAVVEQELAQGLFAQYALRGVRPRRQRVREVQRHGQEAARAVVAAGCVGAGELSPVEDVLRYSTVDTTAVGNRTHPVFLL